MFMKDFSREVDGMFNQIGAADYVPQPARLPIICSLMVSPVFLLIVFLCCLGEDEEYPPQQYRPKPQGAPA